MNNNSRFFNNYSTNTTTPSNNINDLNNINNNNINSRQYISILYTIYNNNFRLINELRNDNLMLRNYIVNEYERSVSNQNHTRLNNIRRVFPRTPYPIFNNFNSTFFDSVPVPPSNEQIQLATVTTYFNNIVGPLNSNCPITLETFENNSVITLIKHCGHIFKPESLNNWFTENNICPICRYDIRNYTANTETNYELIDSSNIVVNTTTSDTENATNEPINNNNNTSITNLRVNTEEELTNQIDNMLTQLFNSNSNINSDTSGNFVITYTF